MLHRDSWGLSARTLTCPGQTSRDDEFYTDLRFADFFINGDRNPWKTQEYDKKYKIPVHSLFLFCSGRFLPGTNFLNEKAGSDPGFCSTFSHPKKSLPNPRRNNRMRAPHVFCEPNLHLLFFLG